MIWDGRGDRLVDARWTMLPGRVADDTRLAVIHLRLLLHMGRQNAQRGWLRLSQTEMAATWQVSRQRLNEAIGQLVAWGYVERRGQDETGESFCLYRVSDKEPDQQVVHTPSTGGEGGEQGEGGECPAQGTPPGGVSPPGDTRVPKLGDTSVPYIGHTTDYPTIAETLPPTPQGAGEGQLQLGSDGRGWARRWTAEARAAVAEVRGSVTRSAIATHLLEPLRGLLNPPAEADAACYVRQLAAQVDATSPEALAAVAGRLVRERKRDLPSVADIATAVRTELARRAAPAAAPPADGDLLTLGPDDPLFPVLHAEAVLAMEAINPAMARRVAEGRVVRIRRAAYEARRAALPAPLPAAPASEPGASP